MTDGVGPDRSGRILLTFAAAAVGFAAADTYVVVLALPDMMAGAGLSADELQRGAPIVSGFLLGYVAILPLVGRISDVRGRVPVLVGSLVAFALGSMVTAAAFDLPSMVVGRFLQGVGGGGLVAATLALVADLYPVHRRGVPLGVVGAVQELGSVLGPLYGALVLVVGDWRDIFWVNLAVGLVLAAALRRTAPTGTDRSTRLDWPGAALGAVVLGCLLLVMLSPRQLTTDVTLGLAFVPVAGDSRWLSPLGLVMVGAVVLFVLRCLSARHPLLRLRSWPQIGREVDLLGAAALSLCLAGIILAFATTDPRLEMLSPAGPWLLGLSAVAGAAAWLRTRSATRPLVPHGALSATPAWGALVVSFLIGAALIAALVDIPLFARLTVHPESQLGAALVLVRFLVALPVGAVIGGWLTHRGRPGPLVAVGMTLAAASFVVMSQWGLESLDDPLATVPLVLAGLGFGLAIAPVNAALLASTETDVHGVASAFLVVARMVGMLVGISALTVLGLRRYYDEQATLPGPMEVCGEGISRCDQYTLLLQEAALVELQTVFVGAACCAAAAGLVALVVLRQAATRLTDPTAAV